MDAASWASLAEHAISTGRYTEGWYNQNYVDVLPSGEQVVVRIPHSGRDRLEPRALDEVSVLQAARAVGINVPEVLWENMQPYFQVHSFANGTLVNDLCPRGERLPPTFINAVVEATVRLGEVLKNRLKFHPSESFGNTSKSFLRDLAQREVTIYRECRSTVPSLYAWLGMPDDPFVRLFNVISSLTDRRFQLCHGDIERRNCLTANGEIVFLDWELAQWGDPLWEISIHMTRTQYLPAERQRLMALFHEKVSEHAIAGIEKDLPTYIMYEVIRAAINDSYRYLVRVRRGCAEATTVMLAHELEWKYTILASYIRTKTPSVDAIAEFLLSEVR